jgi:hypothetical protein
METGPILEYMAEREQAYREAVVYPDAARRAQWAREPRVAQREERLGRMAAPPRAEPAPRGQSSTGPDAAARPAGPIRLVRVVRGGWKPSAPGRSTNP